MEKRSFKDVLNPQSRRDFLKTSVVVGAVAAGVAPVSGEFFVETAQASPVHSLIAADQLSTLTAFYTAMDASKGWVDLSANNLSYLIADQATLTGGLTVSYLDGSHHDKGANVTGWTSTAQKFSWNVKATLADTYVVSALIGGTAGATIKVTVGSNSFTYTIQGSGWNKLSIGQVAIPTGSSTLVLQATAGSGINMQLKSLELVPSSVKAQVDATIQNGRSKGVWMKSSPMGVMYQWGQWGGNPDGTQPAWPQCYAGFNYTAFADRVKNMGADFVVWSITWTSYYIAAPIAAVDAVLAGRTTTNYGQTDYLAQLINALKSRGIRVIFYYHEGHDSNPDASWWNAFWTVSSNGYYARKESAINKWLNIVAEIGNRYGTSLDGWLFDDGAYFYPAPYDLVNTALRAGNADRMISLSASGNDARLTDYQDYFFGEGNTGSSYTTGLSNGKYTQGPYTGEFAFGNFQVDQGDWGVRKGDTAAITTNISRDQFLSIAENAAKTQQAMAYDMRMWTNMGQAQTDIDYFTAAAKLAHAIRDGNIYNDTASSIVYSGSGWYTQSATGCYNSDIHATTTNGDFFTFTFTGTGVDYVTKTYSDEGNIDISVDGTFIKTVNANSSSLVNQTAIYSVSGLASGTHTLKGVKKSGSYMIIDAFIVRR